MKRMLARALFTAFIVTSAVGSVQAAELLANGGFENGSYAGWTLSEPGGFSNVGSNPVFAHTGTFHANLGPAEGTFGSLSQTVATTAGESLSLSFWLANDVSAPVNSFEVLFGGVLVATLTSPPFPASGAYQQLSYDLLATGGAATLEFRYRHDADFWRLDDVSLVARAVGVPEPGTASTMLLALAAAALLGTRMRARSASRA